MTADAKADDSAQGANSAALVLPRSELGRLIEALKAEGRRVVGPTRRDGAIVLGDLDGEGDLPVGLRDEQSPGSYRLVERDDEAVFGHVVGPQSFKSLFHVPEERLFTLRRKGRSFEAEKAPVPGARLALFGARSCDLAAVAVQDRVMMHGPHADPRYASRRADVFVVAVHCGEPGGTCFCASMDTGPRARAGFDVALTELLSREHRFLVEIGSEAGAELVAGLSTRPASDEDLALADQLIEHAKQNMGRTMDTVGLRERVYEAAEHMHWDDVGKRCLTCTSCTMVCPTCFCTHTEDVTDLSGDTAERVRRWDSCFSLDYSYMHGGAVRTSVGARYRHWLTHKLASWHDQFDSSGCVGCGRCLTWCPAGIDITQEVDALAGPASRRAGAPSKRRGGKS